MTYLDCTLPTPAENLACDEALLDQAEAQDGPEVLRLWTAPQPFVVVGYANQVSREVDVNRCRALQIPILRRCSGGGTVLLTPGCLNYTLILPIVPGGPWATITDANSSIMGRHRDALTALLRKPVSIEGCTDLAIAGLKFSGNAQKRKRRWLLFHGTFLLDCDLALMTNLLPSPSRQPDYRQARSHTEFLAPLGLPSALVKETVRRTWQAEAPLSNIPQTRIDDLARTRYSTDEWNFRR